MTSWDAAAKIELERSRGSNVAKAENFIKGMQGVLGRTVGLLSTKARDVG